jgi:hypothetical protein
VISVTTRLRTGRSGVRIKAKENHFLFSKTVETGSGAHPAYYSIGLAFFSGGKAAGA